MSSFFVARQPDSKSGSSFRSKRLEPWINAHLPSGNLTWLLKMAIYSWFPHQNWWFSIVMLVYQRLLFIDQIKNLPIFGESKTDGDSFQSGPWLPRCRRRNPQEPGARCRRECLPGITCHPPEICHSVRSLWPKMGCFRRSTISMCRKGFRLWEIYMCFQMVTCNW